ncbi:hypothetical protein ILUMI_05675 [Ignelater luminosus]|uniref:Uncharacterized protein n=1 Tax=Ignelater luminosus TaxID=2038154 RepID=A0A8K0GIG5_IGNLU|nr:hypothetical protein ILUMI_05675 [Ignelater luminosus]
MKKNPEPQILEGDVKHVKVKEVASKVENLYRPVMVNGVSLNGMVDNGSSMCIVKESVVRHEKWSIRLDEVKLYGYECSDLAHGYLQMPLVEGTNEKTAFITSDKTGQVERMIFSSYEFCRFVWTVEKQNLCMPPRRFAIGSKGLDRNVEQIGACASGYQDGETCIKTKERTRIKSQGLDKKGNTTFTQQSTKTRLGESCQQSVKCYNCGEPHIVNQCKKSSRVKVKKESTLLMEERPREGFFINLELEKSGNVLHLQNCYDTVKHLQWAPLTENRVFEGINGSRLQMLGLINFSVTVLSICLDLSFYIVPDCAISHKCLLGRDFVSNEKIKVSFSGKTLSMEPTCLEMSNDLSEILSIININYVGKNEVDLNSCTDIPFQERQSLVQVFDQYYFDPIRPESPKLKYQMNIVVQPNHVPFCYKPRRLPYAERAAANDIVKDLFDQGRSISAIEAMKEINQLKDNLVLKQGTRFLPHSVRDLMAKLRENGCSGVDEENMKTTAAEFYKISKEYLEQWTLF